jgi:hypothetical protein
MADGLAAAFMDLGRLPRRACTPDHRPGRHQLRCRWGVPPLGIWATLRLVEAGHDRYAVGWWAVDERRRRHLEAVADSFTPG